eukprot:8728029-Karenia_brevis.AAC.1
MKKSFEKNAGWNFITENLAAFQDYYPWCFIYQYVSRMPSMQRVVKWELSNMLVVYWLDGH